jgi:hypothetical protein
MDLCRIFILNPLTIRKSDGLIKIINISVTSPYLGQFVNIHFGL